MYVYVCVSLSFGPTSSEMSLIFSSNAFAYLVLLKAWLWCFNFKDLFDTLWECIYGILFHEHFMNYNAELAIIKLILIELGSILRTL